MKFRRRFAPVLLLALPAFTAALSVADVPDSLSHLSKDGNPEVPLSNKDVGTKDAPVDGLDGKPHAGPFVESTQRKKHSAVAEDLGPSKKAGNADSDGFSTEGSASTKKLLSDLQNDVPGVMQDESRPKPKKGTTGTEGGVSEKTLQQERKELAGQGELRAPERPKEAPPLPAAEREIIEEQKSGNIGNDKNADKLGNKDASGLTKPADLPDKPHEIPHPSPPNSKTDPQDTEPPATQKPQLGQSDEDEERDGVIQPFHSFILSYSMIIVSEIGDKTFLVAALMAMRHARLLVFSAAFSALIAMTVLSAVLGHAVPTLLPQRLTTFAAAILFLIFGGKLLREGLAMSPDEGVGEEMKEVEMELEEKEHLVRRNSRKGSEISPYALESGRGRRSRSNSRLPAPPRSPSSSRSRSASPANARTLQSFLLGLNNLFSLLLSPAWVQTFIMTFLGEWGDRSQIATIAMAAGQDYWWVTLGALVGHACCTAVAVIGGRAIAGKVSMRLVTLGGAIAFIVFGVIYLAEGVYSG